MRAYQNLKILSQKYNIYLLVLNFTFKELAVDPGLVNYCEEVVFIPVNYDLKLFLQRLAYKISKRLYFRVYKKPSEWQHITPLQLSKLSRYVFRGVQFDVIHIFRMYMIPFAQPFVKNFSGRLQLDLDDFESITRKQISQLELLKIATTKPSIFTCELINCGRLLAGQAQIASFLP